VGTTAPNGGTRDASTTSVYKKMLGLEQHVGEVTEDKMELMETIFRE